MVKTLINAFGSVGEDFVVGSEYHFFGNAVRLSTESF